MGKLSVILIVRNEEKNIRNCLESIKWADEIVIIDQSSTDKTREIAQKYTDKIFITSVKGTCNADRMFGILKASYDWILFLDADELVTPTLKEEIQQILKEPKGYTSFYLGRKNFFSGKWIKGGGWYPAYSIKLFRKGFAYFPNQVHRDGWAKGGKTSFLKEKSLHYTYESLAQYFKKFNRFTTRSAEEAYQERIRIRWYNFLPFFFIKPLFYFLRKYFLRMGFKDGFYGFFIAFSSGLTVFMHYTKIWELQKNVRDMRYL